MILEEVVTCFGTSGREKKVAELIRDIIKDKVDEIFTDALGNLIVRKKGPGKRIMFAAHMDQIALIVTHVDEKGFLRFAPVGDHNPINLFGQRVIFDNGVQGIIGNDEVKNLSEINMNKLYIDIGALNHAEASKAVEVGDMCIFNTTFYENETCIMSRSIEDRIGCFVMIDAILNETSKNDCYFAFTVQKEVGLRGARVSSYRIDPEYFISIDVTKTCDTYDGTKMNVKLGEGFALKLKDSDMITNEEVKNMMLDIANKENIKYQFEVLEGGTADAAAAQVTRAGIKSGCVSVPTRWAHSGSEIVNKFDLGEAIRMVKGIMNYEFKE
ncbi:MAG: M42 family peptidase [Oscillospiraceae bacterium]|nr:M42 family peptidase [Oscillospiraceae bacterium]